MPAGELRPIIERVYWSATQALVDDPDELIEEALQYLQRASVACPGILARLADDDITRRWEADTALGSAAPLQ